MKRNPIRILLVEDSLDDVDLFTLALKKSLAAIELDIVNDGEEALRYLKRMNSYTKITLPDLILLDINMPKMSGHEVLRELKQDRLLKIIPVIMMTTSQAPADITESYARGAACYLTKPDRFEDLKVLIRRLSDFWTLSEYSPECLQN
jgi:chemotaxis family two-component system response regulator Rcp1